jgi:acyl carrier protein
MPIQTDALDYICARLAAMGNLGDAKDMPSLKIDEIGIDSLELTELIMEIEDRYSVVIDDSVLSDSTTISELASYISASQG